VIFRFLPNLPFLFGKSYPESLYAQRIFDTLDFPTPITEARSFRVTDVCSLRATAFVRFFEVMSIPTFAKTNYPRVRNQHPVAKDTSCQLMKRQPFPSEPVCKPVPISKVHTFEETRGKQPGFDYLQPTELDFDRNKCLSQLICAQLGSVCSGNIVL
jgi:hypothetical protein